MLWKWHTGSRNSVQILFLFRFKLFFSSWLCTFLICLVEGGVGSSMTFIGRAAEIVRTASISWALILLLAPVGSTQFKGKIFPEFRGSKMSSIDSGGIFLISNNSNFGFGFQSSDDVTLFSLSIIHMSSKTIVWSANSDNPVSDSDIVVFDKSGNAYLEKGDGVIWSTNTTGKAVSAIELRDSGNLVLIGEDGSSTFWESFHHPSDTLLSGQDFVEEKMTLSKRSSKSAKLSYVLEIKSGDMVLSAGYNTPQPYWSMREDRRTIFNKGFGEVSRAAINGSSWRFYDRNGTFVWQFIISSTANHDTIWAATLGADGSIVFLDLQIGGSVSSPNNIPGDKCSTPEICDSYLACHDSNQCSCLPALASFPKCRLANFTPCTPVPVELVSAGYETSYFALSFVSPSLQTDLNGCKASCLKNCSCLALFFETKSGNCFLFDGLGAFQASGSSSGYTSYIKVPLIKNGRTTEGERKRLPYVVAIVVSAAFIIVGLLLCFARYKYKPRKKAPETHIDGTDDDDDLLGSIPGNPTRFSYKDLETATNNFTIKLGQGGFGSVYEGKLPNGTRLAVKKLEAVIGQGNKEFRAEVRIIGSIHHVHLVRLKGFCVEGSQKLLAYEYMGNGSLDKWIFRKTKNKEHPMLSWDTRYTIALETAKGLAYLHEDCESKIVHCDIKPENVLLDDNFHAKVSDFGLAKLMTREQSHVFTTMRGTRGYLAPEWITSYAISEKSDVYSYGMVLLEIVGGRKSYDPSETSENSYFPSMAFKKLEEGKLKELLDSSIEGDERVLTAIKVALWCIQEDMSVRPSMAKVVQMLEGVTPVPHPPTSCPLGSRVQLNLFRVTSTDEGTSSGTTDRNDDSYLSNAQLSGPR